MGPRVLIVDDHAPFRAVARVMLESGGFEVVGEAASGAQALSAAATLRPDVVLLDVQLPDTDGFLVSRALRRSADGACVVLCSIRDAGAYGARVVECGAAGFVEKSQLSAAVVAGYLNVG
ncbi:MAG: response regulator transcription factor [Pseudonocardiaceae bacterium]